MLGDTSRQSAKIKKSLETPMGSPLKKEKDETDLEIEAVILTNQNPDPVPLLNEQQLKIKEENDKKGQHLIKLENVNNYLSKILDDFSAPSKLKGVCLITSKKKVVQSLIIKKTKEIHRMEILPSFENLIGKYKWNKMNVF